MNKQITLNKPTRRWIVREVEAGRMTTAEAIDWIKAISKNPSGLLKYWMKEYASDVALTLPVMTEKEKQKIEQLQKRLKDLEKELERVQMKNLALETMIDLAEDQLRISIRKKSGPKQ